MLDYKSQFDKEALQELQRQEKIGKDKVQAVEIKALKECNKEEIDRFYRVMVWHYYQEYRTNDELKDWVKLEAQKAALSYFRELQKTAVSEALEVVDNYIEQQKFELPEPGKMDSTKAIERNTELQLLQRELDLIDDPEELYFAARYYENNATLARPVDRIVKARLKEIGTAEAQKIAGRIDRERQPDFTPLEKLKNKLKFLLNQDMWPLGEMQEQSNGDLKPAEGWRDPKTDMSKGTIRPENENARLEEDIFDPEEQKPELGEIVS